MPPNPKASRGQNLKPTMITQEEISHRKRIMKSHGLNQNDVSFDAFMQEDRPCFYTYCIGVLASKLAYAEKKLQYYEPVNELQPC